MTERTVSEIETTLREVREWIAKGTFLQSPSTASAMLASIDAALSTGHEQQQQGQSRSQARRIAAQSGEPVKP